jgi:hypothetical protein
MLVRNFRSEGGMLVRRTSRQGPYLVRTDRPRRPEQTPLHRAVRQGWLELEASSEERGELPGGTSADELRRYRGLRGSAGFAAAAVHRHLHRHSIRLDGENQPTRTSTCTDRRRPIQMPPSPSGPLDPLSGAPALGGSGRGDDSALAGEFPQLTICE